MKASKIFALSCVAMAMFHHASFAVTDSTGNTPLLGNPRLDCSNPVAASMCQNILDTAGGGGASERSWSSYFSGQTRCTGLIPFQTCATIRSDGVIAPSAGNIVFSNNPTPPIGRQSIYWAAQTNGLWFTGSSPAVLISGNSVCSTGLVGVAAYTTAPVFASNADIVNGRPPVDFKITPTIVCGTDTGGTPE